MTETTVREWTHEGRPELNRRGLEPAEGPWLDEPDKRQWVDPATDLDCLMVRNGMGAWCGYVGLAEEHPFFGVGYDECVAGDCSEDWCYQHSPNGKVSVHGGLTFAAFCHESERGEGFGICHTPFEGRPDRVWWLGFDCNHSGDYSPYDAAHAQQKNGRYPWGLIPGDQYRDVAYVTAECVRLAAQLANLQAELDTIPASVVTPQADVAAVGVGA